MLITSIASATAVADVGGIGQTPGRQRHWLVNESICGERAGAVSIDVIAAHSVVPLQSEIGEAASVAISGAGRLGRIWRYDESHPDTLGAVDEPTTLLSLHSLHSRTPRAARGADLCGPRSIDEVDDQPAHNPALGFFQMRARMLIEGASEGQRSFTLGLGTFAAGEGCHALHRHANAAEVFYVWEGRGVHLTGDGAEHPIGAGELVYVPAGEWHGFRNNGTAPARAFFGYLGVDLRSGAGYEVMHPVC